MEKDKMTKELLKFKTDTKDVLYQELITYKIINGMLTKEIVTRKFKKDDDYIDSWSSNPLCEAKED